VRLQTLCVRGDDDAEALRAPRLLAQPATRSVDVACQHHGVATSELGMQLDGVIRIEIDSARDSSPVANAAGRRG